MKIGTIVELKVECLGNSIGTKGVVYENYIDYDDTSKIAASIIFKNGDYDGFSYNEQKMFLKYVRHSVDYSCYNFRNVMQVSRDFRDGYWNEILGI